MRWASALWEVFVLRFEEALERYRKRRLTAEEFAARGGRDGEDDYSSAYDPDGKPIANTCR